MGIVCQRKKPSSLGIIEQPADVLRGGPARASMDEVRWPFLS
jgi:hypothetical protein